jgi:hypothetical protein
MRARKDGDCPHPDFAGEMRRPRIVANEQVERLKDLAEIFERNQPAERVDRLVQSEGPAGMDGFLAICRPADEDKPDRADGEQIFRQFNEIG